MKRNYNIPQTALVDFGADSEVMEFTNITSATGPAETTAPGRQVRITTRYI